MEDVICEADDATKVEDDGDAVVDGMHTPHTTRFNINLINSINKIK